jgi:hypothetical protein
VPNLPDGLVAALGGGRPGGAVTYRAEPSPEATRVRPVVGEGRSACSGQAAIAHGTKRKFLHLHRPLLVDSVAP